jgi:hypothetical protein
MLNERTSPSPNGFGMLAMQTAVPAHGCSADRRELGVRELQAGISQPGDGERRRGIVTWLALRRILDAFRRAND